MEDNFIRKKLSPIFGGFFRLLRLNKKYTLRSYCKKFDKDPVFISKMERGKVAPPSDLNELAVSVGLEENSQDWDHFFTFAEISREYFLFEKMSDKEVVAKLPLLISLDKKKLDSFIELIKKA